MLRLGAHVSIAGGLHLAFKRAHAVGCEAMQIWVKNSRQWQAPPLTAEEIDLFRATARRSSVHPVVAHAAYLINIASPDDALYRKSCDALVAEVERCEALGVPYLVLHPGSHTGAGDDAGLSRVSQGLDAVHAALPGYTTRILLENSAGQGTNLGRTFEQLARILNLTCESERLGLCFDTCHALAAGYDLRTPEGYAITIEQIAACVGLDRLRVLHLNDGKYNLGEKKDRHEHVGWGYVGLEAFRRILNDPRLDGRPGLLELQTSEDMHEYVENLDRLRALGATPEEDQDGIDPTTVA